MVGDNDDVLFHAVPLASNGAPIRLPLPLPLCNDVDIPDGTWTAGAADDTGWMLRLVGPLLPPPPLPPLVAPKWPCNWTLFNEVDIKFDVFDEFAWLTMDGGVVDDVTVAVVVAGSAWTTDDLGDDADVELWLVDAVAAVTDAFNVMEDECSDDAPDAYKQYRGILVANKINWYTK